VIQAHLHEAAPRAHERNPDLSLFLSEVIATLLAKQPAGRFESAAALHDVLTQGEQSEWWAEHEPVDAVHLPTIRVNRETALHGRAENLEALGDAWKRARAGEGNTIWLEGEAGIGKTRLVDEFVKGVEGAHVLYGSYPPSGGMGGFSDAILGKFGSTRLADSLAPYLTETPSLVPGFAAMVKHEAPPTGSEAVQGESLQAVAVHLMRALAAEKPTLWILDDLHFAPQESRDVVLAMARAVEGHRVLLVATARPGVAQEDFSRLDNFQRQTLTRLGGRDIVHLLTDAFRSEDLAERLAGKIAVKSDGVPFFVFEMIRGLKEGNFITQTGDGTYVQTQVVSDIEVPSAVKDLIEARMRGLDDDDRDLLDVAAVQGMEFEPDLIAEVLDLKPVKVLRRLAAIERRTGLVRAAGDNVRFDQNQIQEVLYRELLPKLRSEYHMLLAEAYEGDDPVFVAHHHLHGSMPEKALPHLEPAFDKLRKSYRNEALIELAGRALDVGGLLAGEVRAKALLRLANCLYLLGRRAEQRSALDEAVAIADETGEPALRSRARRTLGDLLYRTSGVEEAQPLVAESLELARACGDKKQEAAALAVTGGICTGLGKTAEALKYYARARKLRGELEDREGVESIEHLEALVLWRLGRIEEARARIERILARAHETADRYTEASASGNLGVMCSELGRVSEARDHYERALELNRAAGNRPGEAIVTGNLGNLYKKLGCFDRARSCHRRFHALSREIGHAAGEGVALVNLGPLLASLGQVDEARSTLEESLRILRGIEARREESYALHALGELLEQTGDSEGARQWYEQALALRREISYARGVASTLTALGRMEAAPALLEEALALARETEVPELIFAATLERARLPGGAVAAALEALGSVEEEVGPVERYRLWQLTGDAAHLEEAKRLLDFRVEHAPEECRESMIENVPLHREIMEAYGAR
jgi:tetratricopeptide (TPR) repeat protein